MSRSSGMVNNLTFRLFRITKSFRNKLCKRTVRSPWCSQSCREQGLHPQILPLEVVLFKGGRSSTGSFNYDTAYSFHSGGLQVSYGDAAV